MIFFKFILYLFILIMYKYKCCAKTHTGKRCKNKKYNNLSYCKTHIDCSKIVKKQCIELIRKMNTVTYEKSILFNILCCFLKYGFNKKLFHTNDTELIDIEYNQGLNKFNLKLNGNYMFYSVVNKINEKIREINNNNYPKKLFSLIPKSNWMKIFVKVNKDKFKNYDKYNDPYPYITTPVMVIYKYCTYVNNDGEEEYFKSMYSNFVPNLRYLLDEDSNKIVFRYKRKYFSKNF